MQKFCISCDETLGEHFECSSCYYTNEFNKDEFYTEKIVWKHLSKEEREEETKKRKLSEKEEEESEMFWTELCDENQENEPSRKKLKVVSQVTPVTPVKRVGSWDSYLHNKLLRC